MRSPEDVQAALHTAGSEAQVKIYASSTRTAEEAAQSIGTEVGSIVKSLCFMIDSQPVIVLVAGDRRADDRKLADHFQLSRKKVRIATAEETIEHTGYAPGGVPPLGHANPLPVLIDDSLGRFQTVYGAAGSANAIFPVSFADLCLITNGQVLALSKTE